MDLRSRHPDILEQDFLLMNEEEHQEKWDGISLSLVLNFVPEPKDRGMYRVFIRQRDRYPCSCFFRQDATLGA